MAEDILQELEWRGAINQTTDEAGLRDQMAKEQIEIGRASCRERV